MTAHCADPRPLIIDSFAGGGGASEGIRAALGRDPDYALNHDRLALAMHRINHPNTHHIEEDVWNVDAVSLCSGREVGLLWMSPDCKDFSKAKGGKPREQSIRGLAWVGVGWIKSLPKRQRPKVVLLENVEEFQDWGPLLEDGTRCPARRGATFRAFVGAFQAMGYKVEWKELRACDYGAPTIRKRLFLIARRDGLPIVWPEATHGAPGSEGVRSGRLLPWRIVADCIDWSLPCPSIFDTSAEIWRKHGIRAKRPLAGNTEARIAKGTVRYVLKAAKPFLVQVNHGGQVGGRTHDLGVPSATLTAGRGEALITPFVSYAQQGGRNRDIADPLHTITASPKDHNAIIAPFLVPRYGEAQGQEPRTRTVEGPAPVIVPTGNEGALAAVHLSRQFGASVGSAAHEPVGTITAGGDGKAALVAAFLAQHNTDMVGHDARTPLSTIVGKGSTQGLVAAHLLNLRGSDRRDGPVDAPAPTVTGGGNHAAAVYAFLTKYYGEGLPCQGADEPAHTLTTKPRHGLVTVTVQGEPYAIVDIGMRMLTPRERFNAQGFRSDYVIDRGELEDGTIVPLTLEQQGRSCGNSVCPDMARVLVAANYREPVARRRPAAAALMAAE